jgi:glycosyltransferase involved in cell wall biosynthesis
MNESIASVGALNLLHIIPRFVGGGPERSLLAFAASERIIGQINRHVVAVLEPPVATHMFVAARRLGVKLAICPEPAKFAWLIENADIVVVHFWNHPALTTFLRSFVFPPTRVLVWSRILGLRAPQVLTEEITSFADRLVLTSELSHETAGARAARERGIPVDYIPGIADMSRLEGFTPRQRDGICIGYIGVVNDAKMHPRFAEMTAAIRIPDARFVVCGGGGGESELRRRFAALGIGARVDIRGPVEDIRSALEEFDIFGYPLAEDTYATSEKVLQEAMWVGVPPVVFGHGGVRCLVEPNSTGLVVTTEDEYARAIERLARDPVLRRRLGAGARSFARSAFDPTRWSGAAGQVLSALRAEPRRFRPTLPGANDSAAANFVRSLGDQAGPFAISFAGLAKHSVEQVAAADREIAVVSPLLARGEGGVAHHRNVFPYDPHLRLWAGLVSGSAGAHAIAAAELAAADVLGLGDRGAALRNLLFPLGYDLRLALHDEPQLKSKP